MNEETAAELSVDTNVHVFFEPGAPQRVVLDTDELFERTRTKRTAAAEDAQAKEMLQQEEQEQRRRKLLQK